MLLHNVPSSFGRLVPKPEKSALSRELYDDNVSVQDQIENLRVKISLKERYNRVLKDEMEESRMGASTVIRDLYQETKFLRTQFVEAINLERTTVQKAMRTHRQFQLAMRSTIPNMAIPWLDDKLFDLGKRLNCLLFNLYFKRRKLEEVELVVHTMEKWPRPGSTPSEILAMEHIHKIEIDIENMKVKLETASILFGRYHRIKFILIEERGKYRPVLRTLEIQLANQRKELSQLKKMLADAVVFQNDANKKLSITETEAGENRRRRKRQMVKMKKAVQKILDANQLVTTSGTGASHGGNRLSYVSAEANQTSDENESIRLKKFEMERFQDRTRRIVEAMKVRDLTYIPLRYQTVMELGRRFEKERKGKEDLRNLLLRQQNMLNLVLCHFLYTGQREEAGFNERRAEGEAKHGAVEEKIRATRSRMERYGELIVDVRLALLALIEKFGDSPKTRKRFVNSDLMGQIRMVRKKVTTLVEAVEELESQVPPEEEGEHKLYAAYIRSNPIPQRLIRVGTPVKDEESDGDEEFGDLKVPGRLEIKAKSLRFLNHAKLKRGIGI